MSNRWQDLEKVKKFEIELSSHCNARCPLCIRQMLGTDKERPGFKKGHLTLQQMKTFVSQVPNPRDVVLYMAGVGGDPMMNPEAVEIFRLCAETGFKSVTIDTNGSLRSKAVWKELGQISKMSGPDKDRRKMQVTFSVDGLADTNHLYRIRTDFNKIMENAQTYINAGGIAEWKYIIFKHNEHQVKEAEAMAKDMGFMTFISEPSVRHYDPKDSSYARNEGMGELVPDAPSVTPKERIRYNATTVMAKEIACKVMKKNMMYITHEFKVLPCCYFHSWQVIDEYLIRTKVGHSSDSMPFFAGFQNDLNYRSLREVMEDPWWDMLMTKWNTCDPVVCANNCNQNKYWDKTKKFDRLWSEGEVNVPEYRKENV
tara:strand:- start:8142 stop:9251 length:1110 start_codon:yes stop_codon:yes gene_type:complete